MKILNQHSSLFAAVMLCAALSVTIAKAEARQRLTQKDCSQIFLRTDDCQSSTNIEGELYCKAWYRGFGDDPDEFLGYVFLKSFSFEGTKAALLIGITENSSVYRVKVKGVDSINQQFLSQFEGKRFGDSFEIARTPEDILYVPSKIKAIRGDMQTSQTISNVVKEALDSINILKKL